MSHADTSDSREEAAHYLNTDLDLESEVDLAGLASHLASRGVFALHVTKGDNGRWYATFETDEQADEPEVNIDVMLTALEALPDDLRSVWEGCSLREFDIGYDCGGVPWSFNQGLSNALLRRLAALGACLRVTLYPMSRTQDGASNAGAAHEA